MATPIGSDVVTSIARRYILPEITDNVYNTNLLLFRLNSSNKKIVRGGTQIRSHSCTAVWPLVARTRASTCWT